MSTSGTDFLYPFIEGEAEDSTALLRALERSAAAKIDESAALRAATLERCADEVAVIATKMAARLKTGGRCFAFGNGGSATDATALVQLLAHPPYGRPLAARALVADQAVLTALANDIGFDVVYARQLIAHARPGDVAIGFSTSGNSANVIAAFVEARRRDVLTIGFAGYDGGQMAASPDLEHCLVVRAESIHRIQEAQASLAYLLFEQVERAIANDRSEP